MENLKVRRRLNLSKWDVLVVDDDLGGRMLMEGIFTWYKANIYLAESGADALGQMQKIPRLTVVLCDILMPRMNGYVFLSELRRLSTLPLREIPVIALTAQAMPGDQERILNAGF